MALQKMISRMAWSGDLLKSKVPEQEYYQCKHLRLVKSGSEFFDLLENLIGSARHSVHLQTYIFANDETGSRIANALKEAARRNVTVFVLADGYASQGLPDLFIEKLQAAGVHFQYFDPLLKSKYFYFGRRLHHKVVAIDSEYALVGGINISDNYNDTVDAPAWLDWAMYVEGNIAVGLNAVCERRLKIQKTREEPKTPETSDGINYQIRIRINDWVRRKREITRSYLSMLRSATSHVTIMSSYFLPGKELRKQMALAAKRGVKIRVVMGSYSDIMLARYAEQYMYRWLLRNNVEIYEYLPKIIHSKLATADGKWLTVGSYNVNNISAYASIELNLDVNDVKFVQLVQDRLNRIIELDCILITEEEYRMRATLWQRFLQRSAYDIFRFTFFIFTFYFKQREPGRVE
jgi:cardiolipin synthase